MATSPPQTTAPAARRLPADERRAQILREAAQLFGTHGFKGTTTSHSACMITLNPSGRSGAGGRTPRATTREDQVRGGDQ